MLLMMRARHLALIGALLAPLALAACEDEAPIEEAGEDAGEVLEDTGEAVEDTAEEVEEGAD